MNNDLIHVNTLPPFKRMCMTIGELPTSYLESMTYYEMLVWLSNYLEKTVIPTINNNGEAVEELQGLYIQLKSFVDNYFDNLDVQDEINNKLDDMAESGELTDIIAQYLGLAGMLTYNTVTEMKAAENLTNGSICKTLGYYAINDGGAGTYKVRAILNTDVVDEGSIIALSDNNLVAELMINDIVNIKQFGARDNTNDGDYSTKISAAFNYAITNNKTIYIPNGTYNYSGNAITFVNDLRITGDSPYFSIINITSDIYLFNSTVGIRDLKITNVGFTGGKGYIHNLFTSTYTSGVKIIDNCRFFSYTKVAISSASIDNPYWRISNCTFRGTTTSIGIVLPGGANMSVIEKCSFELNGVHIKLPGKSQDVKIINNDFIEWQRMAEIDIWFVASSLESTTGMGCFISGNKFGDENAGNNSIRILFANDTTFRVDNAAFLENIVYSTSITTGIIQDLSIVDNEFRVRTDSTIIGLMVSYVNDLRGIEIYNRYQGLYDNYILYLPNFTATSLWSAHDSNIIRYRGDAETGVRRIKATNSTFFKVIDEYNQYYLSERPELKNKGASNTNNLYYFQEVNLSDIGHFTAYSYDAETNLITSGGNILYIKNLPAINGKDVYFEFEADNNVASPLEPLEYIYVQAKKGGTIQYQTYIPLFSDSRKYRVRLTTETDTNILGFVTIDGKSFHMSNLKVYIADEPIAINDDKYVKALYFGSTTNSNGNKLYFDPADNKLKVKLSDNTTKIISYE